MYYITIQDVKAIIGDLDLHRVCRHRRVHHHEGRPDVRQAALLRRDAQEAPCDVLRRHDWDGRCAADYDEESAADDASAAAVAADTTYPR